MTTDRFHDDLDALLKRHDPARLIDRHSVARISRAVLARMAAEPPPPWWHRLLPVGSRRALPGYAGSLALGLALGLAVGLSGLGQAQAVATPLDLYAYAQPLSPVGLR
ncbi:MAG: hypothetical protein FD176_2281 [Rhodospirillaceae bacterium]|nr:MAG: hypothetical protein FD176_2281 [Rhodospirillaceae bacterium]TNC95599.1 MAG: Uncharacterized protein FD119_2227 [Stygiobacter sp.]